MREEVIPSAETWTIRRVLGWAAEDFRQRGFENPRLAAELLLGHTLDLDRVQLILQADRPLESNELAAYREGIKRHRAREPLAYILGTKEFYGLVFRVDPRVLIPRPDTELLVDVALERTRRRHMYGRSVDLCTGSGCVAIAFATQRPTWRVTATDIEEGALAVAQSNALRLGVVFAIRFVQGDLWEPLLGEPPYDLVTANPPYIPGDDCAELDPGIRDFEPRIALEGGPDGLCLTRRVVEGAFDRLRPEGVLAVEIAFDQGTRVVSLFEQAGFERVELSRDYGGRERVVSAVRPA